MWTRLRGHHRKIFGVIIFIFIIYFSNLFGKLSDDRGFIPAWLPTTRNMRIFLQPHKSTAIISNSKLCNCEQNLQKNISSQTDELFLLIIVCSAVGHFEQRKAIRETWGNIKSTFDQFKPMSELNNYDSTHYNPSVPISYSLNFSIFGQYSNFNIRVGFLLGRTENTTIQQQIYEENAQFEDIIQENFLDTYFNLTVKSTMLLKWVNDTCPRARYIMKADDDTFVNVVNLVAYLERYGHEKLLLGCKICGNGPSRNKRSKAYVPPGYYEKRYYPNYLAGPGYVLSQDVIRPLYATALDTPFFNLEDVYITGICAELLNMKPMDHIGFTYSKRPLDPCVYHFGINGQSVTPEQMRKLWHQMRNQYLKCDMKNIKLKSFHPWTCS